VSAISLTVKNAGWPARGPAQIALDATLPGGGTLTVAGSGELDQRVVRVTVIAKNLDVAQAQPYLPFRGRVQGRVEARLDVRGRLDPPRMRVRGSVGASDVVLVDGGRQLLTIARLDATGLDYRAPAKVAVDEVRVVKPWALVDRDERGQLSLRAALAIKPRATSAPAAAPPSTDAALKPEIAVRHALFEDGGTNIVDDSVEPAARFQVRGSRLEVHNFTWPVKAPAEVALATPMPRGGRLEGRGTFRVDPSRMDVRVTLAGVALSPAQPYLPVGARLTGNVDGDAQISARFEPLSVSVRGSAAVKELGIGDASRQLLTAGHARAEGVDLQWPGGVRVTRLEIEKPWVLFEREASGRFPLVDLLTPRVPRAPRPTPAGDTASREPAEPLRFSLGTLALSDGFGRFVDRTTEPDFAEELSGVNLTLVGLGNRPGDKARTAVRATLGPSAALSISGELGTIGAPLGVDVLFTLGGYAAPRANAYLDTLFGWTARQGNLALAAHYRIEGDQLDATNDVGADGLDVVRSSARAKPPKWPIGLPLDTFVSLLKDGRGHVELSVPVHGRLSSPEFDLGDAIWSALRGLAFKTVGLPFTLIGKLFVSEDSRIESLSVNPVTFLPGTATPRPEMGEHLDRLAKFLRDKPAIRLRLRPILTVVDVEPLKLEALRERLKARAKDGSDAALREQALRLFTRRFPKREPPAALDELLAALAAEDRAPAAAETALGVRRVAIVRDALVGRGIEVGRLAAQSAPAAVEGEGTGRVEFEITP
jgi:outer membrane protein OmpA-like peptidoglycan-associated protein